MGFPRMCHGKYHGSPHESTVLAWKSHENSKEVLVERRASMEVTLQSHGITIKTSIDVLPWKSDGSPTTEEPREPLWKHCLSAEISVKPYGSPTEVPMKASASAQVPWKFHGSTLGFAMERLCFHGSPMEAPWNHHGSTTKHPLTVCPCRYHGSVAVFPWKPHWKQHPSTRKPPWKCCASMEVSWKSIRKHKVLSRILGASMVLPWYFYGDAHENTVDPWCFRGACMVLAWRRQ